MGAIVANALGEVVGAPTWEQWSKAPTWEQYRFVVTAHFLLDIEYELALLSLAFQAHERLRTHSDTS